MSFNILINNIHWSHWLPDPPWYLCSPRSLFHVLKKVIHVYPLWKLICSQVFIIIQLLICFSQSNSSQAATFLIVLLLRAIGDDMSTKPLPKLIGSLTKIEQTLAWLSSFPVLRSKVFLRTRISFSFIYYLLLKMYFCHIFSMLFDLCTYLFK